MFFRILKKDFKRKRGMNLILLLFIIMATMFLSSSVTNLKVVLGAVDHFIALANTPDLFIIANQKGDKDEVLEFIKQNKLVSSYGVNAGIVLNKSNLAIASRQNHTNDSDKYEPTATAALFNTKNEYMKVFDETGKELTLNKGEVAIPNIEADKNHLQIGDKLVVSVGNVKKELKLAHITKDATFGSSMMGFRRIIVSDNDFQEYRQDKEATIENLYSINTSNVKQLKEEIEAKNFSLFTTIEKSLVKMCYIMDMLIAGVLIIVSICLILIAFLILRFTIVFTIQEDYREIGVMKAIGLRDGGVKGIYMIKYLAIATGGAFIGLIAGFPFGKLLIKSAMTNMVVEDAHTDIFLNILCAIVVILLVLLFCYTSTNKLKKISAIEAIREGGTGERFRGKNCLHLHTKKHLSTPLFLACNDITGSLKRFLVLAVTFCLTTLLILLPLSAIQTLKSDSVLRLLSIAPSDAYVKTDNMERYVTQAGKTLLDDDMKKMEDKMAEIGTPVKVRAEVGYYLNYYTDQNKVKSRIYTAQSYHYGGKDFDMTEGSFPQGTDEVALTRRSAEELGVHIGDTIHMVVDNQDRKVIVSGIFQSMNMMGKDARVSEDFKVDFSNIAGMYALQVDFPKGDNIQADRHLVEKTFPDYTIYDGQGFASSMLGDVVNQLDGLKVLIVGVVLIINALITMLMMKALMTKERDEIAVLKSIGFKNSALKKWQMIRILIVLAIAIVLAILLSKVLSPVTVGQVFVMMGATDIQMVTDPIETYLLYPLLLLVVTGTCAYLSAGSIKHVDIKEMNNG
jgi:putative ABC transport system permease protein